MTKLSELTGNLKDLLGRTEAKAAKKISASLTRHAAEQMEERAVTLKELALTFAKGEATPSQSVSARPGDLLYQRQSKAGDWVVLIWNADSERVITTYRSRDKKYAKVPAGIWKLRGLLATAAA